MFLHSRSPGSTGNPLQAGEERESRAAPLGESSVRRWEKVSDSQISRQERKRSSQSLQLLPGGSPTAVQLQRRQEEPHGSSGANSQSERGDAVTLTNHDARCNFSAE